MLPPLAITSKIGPIIHDLFKESTHPYALPALVGVAVTITAFLVLARILAELKLIGSDVSWIALSSATLIDILACMLLPTAVTLAQSDSDMEKSIYVVLSEVVLYLTLRSIVWLVVVWVAG